jgi:plastocyanin
MKKIILLGLVLTSLIWVAVACSNNSSTSSPVTSSPTATPNPSVVVGATIAYGGATNYNPPNVTITHGQAVVWDTTLNGHTVYLDNYTGTSTTCGSSTNNTSFPVTITFPTAGTYYFHCTVPGHSPCGSSTCGMCTGMAGSVVVN